MVMKEQEGFKVPDNYFKEKKRSLKAIASADTPSEPLLKRMRPRHWLSAASIVFIAFLLSPWQVFEAEENLNFSDLNESEVMDFLNEDPNAFHPENYLSYPIADSLSEIEEIDTEQIEDYLNDHSIQYF